MKRVAPLLLLFLTVMISGCQDAASEVASEDGTDLSVCKSHSDLAHQAMNAPPHHTLIFLDQSSSVDENGVSDEYSNMIRKRVEEDLPNHGSILELVMVHSRTTGRAGALKAVQEIPLPREENFLDETKLGCNQYVSSIGIMLRETWNAIEKRLETPYVNDANRKATDLWGVFEVASISFADGPDDAVRSVYVFSDMLECMSGSDRRCFERTPPAGKMQAETWAEADASHLPEILHIDRDILSQVNFYFVMGRHSLNDATRNVHYYWRALLRNLGVPEKQIHFL